jgi:hypothetical protein
MSPLAKEMLQFDEVDRSLIRELTVRCIEMIQLGYGDKVKALIQNSCAKGERGAAKSADERAIQPPVSEGS